MISGAGDQHAALSALRGAKAGACFAAHDVTFAYLFGSYARDEAGERSDVDIAVHHPSGRSASLELRLALASDLEARAGLPRVEVVVLDTSRLPLLCRVLRERLVVYSADEAARVGFESLARRLCADFMPRAARIDRQLLAGHATGGR